MTAPPVAHPIGQVGETAPTVLAAGGTITCVVRSGLCVRRLLTWALALVGHALRIQVYQVVACGRSLLPRGRGRAMWMVRTWSGRAAVRLADQGDPTVSYLALVGPGVSPVHEGEALVYIQLWHLLWARWGPRVPGPVMYNTSLYVYCCRFIKGNS